MLESWLRAFEVQRHRLSGNRIEPRRGFEGLCNRRGGLRAAPVFEMRPPLPVARFAVSFAGSCALQAHFVLVEALVTQLPTYLCQ
jgi:hypothetical protein